MQRLLAPLRPALRRLASSSSRATGRTSILSVDEIMATDAAGDKNADINAGWSELSVSEALLSARRLQTDPALANELLPKLKSFCEGRNASKLSVTRIIFCHKSLSHLQSKGENVSLLSLRNLENELLWKTRSATLSELSLILSFTAARPELSSIFDEARNQCVKRHDELEDGRTLCGLLHYSQHFEEDYLRQLEEAAVQLCDHWTLDELVEVLSKLGTKKRRPLNLIQSLSRRLREGDQSSDNANDVLSLKQISDVLFALNNLSIRDEKLISAMCDQVRLDELRDSSVLRSILTSLGRLQFLHTDCIRKITDWMCLNKNMLNNKDLVAYLITAASLNHVDENSKPIFDLIHETLTVDKFAEDNDRLWLDIVWSLTVLNKQTKEQVASILASDFYNRLLYNSSMRNPGVTLKLLNINAVAQYIMKDSSLNPIDVIRDPLLRDAKMNIKADRDKLCKSLYQHLATFSKEFSKRVNTQMGFSIDALLQVNPDTLLAKQISNLEEESKDDHVKVAFLVASYGECVRNSNNLNGVASLTQRLLESRDVRTIVVRYDDCNWMRTSQTAAIFLADAMRKATS